MARPDLPSSTRSTEPAPLPERLTEPLSVAHRGAVLPFRRVVPARHAPPSEDAPERPALVPPSPTSIDSAQRARERAELRAFCLFVLAVLVIGNVAFWIALALRPAPLPAPVVVPSLPAVFLAGLASSSPSIPEAPRGATAPSAVPASSPSPRPVGRPRPASKPRRTTDLVDPWSD